jgi:hypothetical protein
MKIKCNLEKIAELEIRMLYFYQLNSAVHHGTQFYPIDAA